MSRILFYSPFNQRSRDTESLMIAFHNKGHKVVSLSQQEGHLINEFLMSKGIEAYSHIVKGNRVGGFYFLKHLFFFIRFCWKRNIQVVYSHLEPANFVASIGQYFIRGNTYLCRHHIDEGQFYQFEKDLYYRITYRLAKKNYCRFQSG
ncbi:MAG: glycosyltransferase [Flammeovirgaceae bacterium]|nr:glycosyltransferase [Flammeovirgaceae bacterium]